MSFYTKILNSIRHNEIVDFTSELNQRIRLLNFSILSVMFFSLLYSLAHIFFFDQINGIIILSFFVLLFVNLIILRVTDNYRLSIIITLILITSLFTYMVFYGVGNNSSIVWGLTYPVVLAFLIDNKRSSLFSIFFLAINILIFIISNYIESLSNYSNDMIMRYISVYLLIFIFLQFYIRIKKHADNIKEKKSIETLQKLSEKNNFLSELSYQIRTPLNNIAGILNLQRDNLEEDIVEEVELSISNLISIVNSIPETFEKKVIQIQGQKTYFNINSVIKKSTNLFQTDKYKNLKFSLNLSGKLPSGVYGDRMALIQIIISVIDFCHHNCIDNTLKIDIISKERITENKKFIIIKISSKLENLSINSAFNFENQFDLEHSNHKEIEFIKELMVSSSGEMNIITDESTISFLFSFDFPEKITDLSEEESKIEAIVKPEFITESKKIKLKDANILLVEDDAMNSKVMTLNLDKHVNKIIIAVNGKEALEKYASTKIDMILMDIRMPLMDGFKTTEKIREAETGTGLQTPIIAVTANASSDVKKKCFEAGMNDYTTKPVNFKILLKKMNIFLE